MSDVGIFLAHFGVKGMKWGVRKDRSPQPVGYTQEPGRKVKTSGGRYGPAHEDAINAAISKQKARASTTDSLSNKELQAMVNRMNLEQQYSRLSAADLSPGKKFVNQLLGRAQKDPIGTYKQAKSYVNTASKLYNAGKSARRASEPFPGPPEYKAWATKELTTGY